MLNRFVKTSASGARTAAEIGRRQIANEPINDYISVGSTRFVTKQALTSDR